MITPAELMRGGTEHGMQRAIFAWVNVALWRGFADAWNPQTYAEKAPLANLTKYAVPDLAWYHAIHNQGHGDKIRGGQAKAEGVKAGVPDTFLPVTRLTRMYPGLYIENKLPQYATRKNGGLSEKQIECIRFLRNQGYGVVVSHSWETTAQALQAYITSGEVIYSEY